MASIQELMDAVIDPSADALWDSVSITTTKKGTVFHQPHTDEEWQELGFNLSAAVHEDIVLTNDRTVTAVMHDGSERVIYAGGHFQVEV